MNRHGDVKIWHDLSTRGLSVVRWIKTVERLFDFAAWWDQ